MTNRRILYCTISILLSLCALTRSWRYVGSDYKGLFIIAILVIVRLNVFLFTPKKSNNSV